MKNLLGTIGLFAILFGGMAVAEYIGEHFATAIGVTFFAVTFYGLYRAGRYVRSIA